MWVGLSQHSYGVFHCMVDDVFDLKSTTVGMICMHGEQRRIAEFALSNVSSFTFYYADDFMYGYDFYYSFLFVYHLQVL